MNRTVAISSIKVLAALLILGVFVTCSLFTSVPITPTGLTVGSPTSSTLTISWTAVTNATTYQLFRATSEKGPFTTKVSDSSATTFTDSGLSVLTTYYYEVQATNTAGSSALSAVASGSTSAPGAIGTLLAVDSNGHFESSSPIVYNQWGEVDTFNDVPSIGKLTNPPSTLGTNVVGAYEEDEYDNAATPTIQTGGFIGTYSYDPATLTITWNELYWYNGSAWIADSTSGTSTDVCQRYYCSNGFQSIFEASTTAGTWVFSWTYTYTDSTNSANNLTDYYTDTITMPAGGTASKGTFTRIQDDYHVQNNIKTEDTNKLFPITVLTGTCTLYPLGVTFANGNEVTAYVTTAANGFSQQSFYSFGSYIMYYPGYASRSILAGKR